ncbi:N-acetylmuramoyl-L-alanine amidase [Pedobacter sp. GSP4]|uniref:N-acetylmuramoyl-L-alanine amidase n=1 Tax=Pedobacter sp. GSP4 TaxID=3453716 RepID=UPI003EEFA28F
MPEKDKPKDFWDKMQLGTTFVSTVLIGLAGVYFTYSYNQRQLKQTQIQQAGQYKLDSLRLLTQVSQAAVQAQLQQVQLQTAQVQAMTQLVPYLASKDAETKKVAFAILRSIDSTSSFPTLGKQASFEENINPEKQPLGHKVNSAHSAFGNLATILNQINADKKIATDPTQPFPKRVGAYNNIVQLADNKKVNRKVVDSAILALDQVRKSPNSPLLGIGFTPKEFAHYLDTLNLQQWRPSFMVLHHTAVPNLQTLPNGFTQANIAGFLKFFTEVQHWNGAPHLFIDDKKIWVINPLTKPGIHSPSWNKISVGIDMLGDYNNESFDGGRGKLVQNNTVAAMALLGRKYHLSLDSIKLHSEDPRTFNKPCPGKHVDKNAIVAQTKHYKSS